MGDVSNLAMTVKSSNATIIAAAREAFEELAGGGDYFINEYDNGVLSVGSHEVSVGSVDELCDKLLGFVAEHGEFAFSVHDEPLADWLGYLRVYAPGHKVFAADCNADGTPVISTEVITTVVASATDLSELQTKIAEMLGAATLAAFNDYAE